jgi:hypothetical protein
MEVSTMSEAEIKHGEYCNELGDNPVDTGMLSGECEQELEHEAERECEQETEKPREQPSCQSDWDYEKSFSDPESLISSGVFVSLRSFVVSKLSKIARIDWDENIFCSANFNNTIQRLQVCSDLSLFARQVSAMLVTHDGRVVLLSLYETDKLLPLWWKYNDKSSKGSRSPRRATLRHLFLADTSAGFGHDNEKLPHKLLASVKLFRGYVEFSPDQIDHVRAAFRKTKEPRAAALDLLHMRNRLGHYDRSDLEDASTVPIQLEH